MDITLINKIELLYANSLKLLDDYDNQCIENKGYNIVKYKLLYEEAVLIIKEMSYKKNSSLFGREKDESFKSSLNTIYQTFNSKELYPSLEEKAANLLYFIVKNHSFVDGNKRIAAFIFLNFLYKNEYMSTEENRMKLNNQVVVALTVMIAVSNPIEKETIIKLITNIL